MHFVWRIYIFRQCIQSKSNLFHIKTGQYTEFRVEEAAILYLTRVKVKVVRIAVSVKVKYVIKAISPAPAGLSQAGEGASSQAGPLSHRSGNYVSLAWESVDCFYIWENSWGS